MTEFLQIWWISVTDLH